MKKPLFLLLVLGLISTTIQAQRTPCSNANLRGDYGFVFNGVFNPDKQRLEPVGKLFPMVSTGVLMAQGTGYGSGVEYDNPPGAESRDGNAKGLTFHSFYTVRPDCTVFLRWEFPDGREVTLAGVLIGLRSGVAQKVFFNHSTVGMYMTGQAEMIVGPLD